MLSKHHRSSRVHFMSKSSRDVTQRRDDPGYGPQPAAQQNTRRVKLAAFEKPVILVTFEDVWSRSVAIGAGFGMTVETLINRYSHHLPAFLSGARSAFHRQAVSVADLTERCYSGATGSRHRR